MSFLTESAVRRLATTLPRAAVAINTQAPRAFSTTLIAHKTATENVKDGLKTVDRAVSDKLVDGLNAAEAAKEKVQGTTSSDVAAKAQEVKGEAKGKAQELKGEAKGAAAQAEGKAKGAADQVKQNL